MIDLDGANSPNADESMSLAHSPATESATSTATGSKPPAMAEAAPAAATDSTSPRTSPGALGSPKAARTARKKVAAKKPLATKSKVSTKKAAVKKTLAKHPVPRKAGAEAATSPNDRAPDTTRRMKLVRDSFTMPQQDYALIAALKERALEHKRPAKKSELLRAGLHALAKLTHGELGGALDALVPLKAGRPKKKAS